MKSHLLIFSSLLFVFNAYSQNDTTQENGFDTPAYWHSCSNEPDSLKHLCTEEAILDYLLEASPLKGSKSQSVTVAFVIDSTGKVGKASVVNGIDEYHNSKALEIVKNMPAWIPGTQNGKPVAIGYTIPVFFEMKTVNEDSDQ